MDETYKLERLLRQGTYPRGPLQIRDLVALKRSNSPE
jgi:hypothetical protein